MMLKEPHFLISVPTFNRCHLLPTVMESINQQGYSKFDVLFVDDCSEDGTPQYIHSLQSRFSNIHYSRMEENSGVNAVRNRIIDIAKTDFSDSFLYFIDDDDQLYQGALAKAAKAICENPGYQWYSLNCIYPDGKPISKIKNYGELSYIDDFMFSKNMRGDLTNIVKVSGIGNAHFSKRFRNAEIWYFWSNLSLSNTLFSINEIGSIKEYLPGGITDKGFNRDRAIDVARYKIETLEPVVGNKKLKHQYVTLAKHLIDQGKHFEAREVLKKVIGFAPFYFRQYRHWLRLFLH